MQRGLCSDPVSTMKSTISMQSLSTSENSNEKIVPCNDCNDDRFCQILSLDYGELDVVRDNESRNVQFIDVNTIPVDSTLIVIGSDYSVFTMVRLFRVFFQIPE